MAELCHWLRDVVRVHLGFRAAGKRLEPRSKQVTAAICPQRQTSSFLTSPDVHLYWSPITTLVSGS